MIVDPHDIAWAAGFFEGEGSFSWGRQKRGCVWSAQLSNTDKEVLERFGRIMGFGVIRVRKVPEGQKPSWTWQASRFETFQATVALLWGQLGSRRRARAREILLASREYYSQGNRGWVVRRCS